MPSPAPTVCALQCTVVEKACINFLTSLNLDASGLAVLMRLWERINNSEAEQLTLERLVSKPWTHATPRIIASVFQELLQPDKCKTSLCRDALDHPSCGALCQLQASKR